MSSAATFKFSIKHTLIKKKQKIQLRFVDISSVFLATKTLHLNVLVLRSQVLLIFLPTLKPYDYTLHFSFYVFLFPVQFLKSYS